MPYPLFDKVDVKLLKITNFPLDTHYDTNNTKNNNTHKNKYKRIAYNTDEQFIVIGPKMRMRTNMNSTGHKDLYLVNDIEVSFFTDIDVAIIKMLSRVFPNIENIYTQSIRRSIYDNNLYLRNYSPDKEIIYFNENDEEITIDDVEMLMEDNNVKYVIPLLSPKLNNTYNCKHLEWDILQIKVFLSNSKSVFSKCIITDDDDSQNAHNAKSVQNAHSTHIDLLDEYLP